MISILFSSHNRSQLLRRSLYHIEKNPPYYPFEVVLADDGSTDDIEGLLRQFSFKSKLIKCDKVAFSKKTGVKPFGNNPAWTNNVAFRHCTGGLIFLQGNDIVAVGNCYNEMLNAMPVDDHYILFSKTYGLTESQQKFLNEDGSNISKEFIFDASRNIMQSAERRAMVTNYLSLTTRKVWETLNGYNEKFLAGQACEDSDFVRRAAKLNDFKAIYCNAVTLHQWHGSATHNIVGGTRMSEGLTRNRSLYNRWNGHFRNEQEWPIGDFVTDVVEINAWQAVL